MEVIEIERGWSVFSEDGKRIGDVVEVHGHYILVSRGLLVVRDLYVPRYAVASAENGTVRLAITDERLRKMGWTSPPPVPPPSDSPAPHLVPSYDAEAPGPPPLSYQGLTESSDTLSGDEARDLFGYNEGDSTEIVSGAGYESYDATGYEGYNSTESDLEILDDYADMGIQIGPTIEVEGAYLAVQRLGDGAPIVFIHGWGFDRRIWESMTLDLPYEYTVVTYDSRGYGGSSAPWAEYSVERASRDLRVILATLDLRGATIVGFDLGAAAALQYVLDGGRRAARLILIAPAVFSHGDTVFAELPEPLRSWAAQVRADRPRLATELAASWAPAATPERQAWLRDSILSAAPHALLQSLSTLAAPDLLGVLETVRIPVHVLLGREDPLAPVERVMDALEGIPARYTLLDTPGHLPMIADPERIVAEIRAAIDASEQTVVETADMHEEATDTAADTAMAEEDSSTETAATVTDEAREDEAVAMESEDGTGDDALGIEPEMAAQEPEATEQQPERDAPTE